MFFLSELGASTTDWVMCYPYGAYNNYTISILEQSDCALAVTTKVGTADLSSQNKFELMRWDTNDFPQ